MKRFVKILSVLVLGCTVLGADAGAYIDHETAVLRVLNKAAGKAQNLRVPVGYSVNHEKLNIAVRSCKQTDPFDAENHFAFVEIFDGNANQIFGGWMNRNEPGSNPMESPDWDIWLNSCED